MKNKESSVFLKLDLSFKKKLLLFVISSLCITTLYLSRSYNLFISGSNSLPGSLFLGIKGKEPFFQDIAVFYYPDFATKVLKAQENLLLAKEVVGVEGDRVESSHSSVRIIRGPNIIWEGSLQNIRTNGQPVNPIQTQVVPYGKVFVVGDNVKSFDSRYQEFGLVSLDQIWGTAKRLF